jgi:hypothetical protein
MDSSGFGARISAGQGALRLELGNSAGHGTGTSARMSETNTGRWNSGWRDGTMLGKK